MKRSPTLDAYFAATLDTEALLQKSITFDDMGESETMRPSSPSVPNITEETQGFTEWVARLLSVTTEYLRKTC